MCRRDVWWSLGLSIVALLIGAAYVYGGWLDRHWLYLGPLGAAGLVTALARGIRESRSPRPLRRLGRGSLTASAFAAALALPSGIRWLSLTLAANAVPLPPHAVNVIQRIDVVACDGRDDFSRYCVTRLPADDVEQFYRRRLADGGWQYLSTNEVQFVPESYHRRRRALTFRQGSRILQVSISAAAWETFVGAAFTDPRPKVPW